MTARFTSWPGTCPSPSSSAPVAASWAPAAEKEKAAASPANHPPGFVRPEPDEVIRLWPGDAPGLVPGGKSETFVNERHANVSVPQLFVYLPPREKSSGTALVICSEAATATWRCAFTWRTSSSFLNDQGLPCSASSIAPGTVTTTWWRTRWRRQASGQDRAQPGRGVGDRPAPHRRAGLLGRGQPVPEPGGRFDDGDPHATDALERVSCRPDFCVLMCLWPNGQDDRRFSAEREFPTDLLCARQGRHDGADQLCQGDRRKAPRPGRRGRDARGRERRPRGFSLRHGRGSRRPVAGGSAAVAREGRDVAPAAPAR